MSPLTSHRAYIEDLNSDNSSLSLSPPTLTKMPFSGVTPSPCVNDFGWGKFTITQEMYWGQLRASLGVVWGRWLRRLGGFIFLHTGPRPVNSWGGYTRTSSTEVTAERG